MLGTKHTVEFLSGHLAFEFQAVYLAAADHDLHCLAHDCERCYVCLQQLEGYAALAQQQLMRKALSPSCGHALAAAAEGERGHQARQDEGMKNGESDTSAMALVSSWLALQACVRLAVVVPAALLAQHQGPFLRSPEHFLGLLNLTPPCLLAEQAPRPSGLWTRSR